MRHAIQLAHKLMAEQIRSHPQGLYMDATLGKGHDIQFILDQPDFSGQVLGFDIQAQAIAYSKDRLKDYPSQHYQLIHDSHSRLEVYLAQEEWVQAAIFNLGYLPGGDHQITTQASSTYEALQALSRRLASGGRVILVVYPGHPAGQLESQSLLSQLATWDQQEWSISQHAFINQINHPPYVILMDKLN